MMKPKEIGKLLASLLICQLAGGIGSLFTASKIPTWYATLAKPSFNPPNWIFGPMWITLYVLMGISFYLVWSKKISKKEAWLFGIQLSLNSLWPILFFGLESPMLGLACIILLLISIALTMIAFYKRSKASAYLLVPYILWVSFASSLNLMIMILN